MPLCAGRHSVVYLAHVHYGVPVYMQGLKTVSPLDSRQKDRLRKCGGKHSNTLDVHCEQSFSFLTYIATTEHSTKPSSELARKNNSRRGRYRNLCREFSQFRGTWNGSANQARARSIAWLSQDKNLHRTSRASPRRLPRLASSVRSGVLGKFLAYVPTRRPSPQFPVPT